LLLGAVVALIFIIIVIVIIVIIVYVIAAVEIGIFVCVMLLETTDVRFVERVKQ
jgi:hypothetical protein